MGVFCSPWGKPSALSECAGPKLGGLAAIRVWAPAPSPTLPGSSRARTILGHSCEGTWGGHSGLRIEIETLRESARLSGTGWDRRQARQRRGPQGAQGDRHRERQGPRGTQKHPERETDRDTDGDGGGGWGVWGVVRDPDWGEKASWRGRGRKTLGGSLGWAGWGMGTAPRFGVSRDPSHFSLMCCMTFHFTSCPLMSGSLGNQSSPSPNPHITSGFYESVLLASALCLLWGVRV